jgi:imidazolonepropionase-like amidohydrolase
MTDRPKNFLIIPPFHDAHIHLMIDGHPATLDDCPFLSAEYFSKGILSLADMGHKSGLGLEFKKVSDRKSPFPMKVRSAGLALYKKGGYGGFLGKGVSGKMEIQAAIRSLTEAGVDFLKVINSGIVTLQQEKPVTEGGFSGEEWKVIQEEAGLNRLPIRCHANSDRAIRQAVDFGVSSVEHGFFVSQETLQAMVEKNVAWTPTAFALLSLKAILSGEEQKYLDRIIDHHLKNLDYAVSIGVKLQVGTDSGSRRVKPGESFFKELQLFKKAGLTLKQTLSAACLDHKEIEQGNYLLVENNFIEMESVEAVFMNGVQVQKELVG